MAQNTSHAVMAQRRGPPKALDDFPTQPWGARALCTHVIDADPVMSVWEPACNRGYLARPLQEHFRRVYRSDVFDYSREQIITADYGGQELVHDFLMPYLPDVISQRGVDWVITNPPFCLGEQFIVRALEIARFGVAMLTRTTFLETQGRYLRLFSQRPPQIIAQFAERLPMLLGRCEQDADTATAYCWLVWYQGQTETDFMWIPLCRKALERPADYPKLSASHLEEELDAERTDQKPTATGSGR